MEEENQSKLFYVCNVKELEVGEQELCADLFTHL